MALKSIRAEIEIIKARLAVKDLSHEIPNGKFLKPMRNTPEAKYYILLSVVLKI